MADPRLESLAEDLRSACRTLWRTRSFTVGAVLTLASALAATTIMFALIHGVLFRPLPVHEQDRLIIAWKEARTSGSARYPFGSSEIEAVARASQLLEAAAGVNRNGVAPGVITDRGVARYANVLLVTGNFFEVLGVRPHLGRTLTARDDRDGAERVIVISHGLWQRYYGRSADSIGRQVLLGERAFVIVGVMPPDLNYPAGVEVWQPANTVPTDGPFGDAARREMTMLGRLRSGVTIAQAASEIAVLSERINENVPSDSTRGMTPIVRSFVDVVVGDVRWTMLALFGAVGLVLLIASANVANLLLVRGETRRTELAVRAALGAGRARIVRQVLAETLVLSMLAGTIGLVVAWLTLPALIAAIPDGLPRVESVRLDAGVVGFSAALVFLSALLAGLAPAVDSARADLIASLRAGSSTMTRATTAGRRTLVVTQVALAVTVVAGAGVLVRSVLKLHAIDLGLAADRLVLVDLHLPAEQYGTRQQRAQFLEGAIARLEAAPMIARVTPVNVSPFENRGWDVPRVTAAGQDADEAARNPSLNLESIFPNYFDTLDIPMVQGRAFTEADREGAVPVAIISEEVASAIWPRQNPIGKRLKLGAISSRAEWREVVGVAASTRYRTLTMPRPTLYLPAMQFQVTADMLVIRSTASLDLIASIANERISSIAPDVQIMRVAPFADLLNPPLARPRFSAALLSAFALAALLLAAIGLYGVLAAHVRLRDREIALRVALGASGKAVRRLVLAEASRLTLLGAVLGVAGAFVAMRSLDGMLYEVDALDPVSVISAPLLLIAAAALASVGPTRRAARADVMTTLRSP